VIYGGKSWTLTNKMEEVLIMRERNILRNIYGPAYENDYWKTKNESRNVE
jgi:hypothetical protein